MPKAKQKSHFSEPPFSLPSQIKLEHQWYFLQFINELAPEVSKAIKKLTPRCVKLFGEFPKPNDDQEELRSLFYKCIWKDSREQDIGIYWLDFLRKNDRELNHLLEIKEKDSSIVNQYIESLTEDRLDSLREKFASYFTKPKETISISDLQYAFQLFINDYERENDKNYINQLKLKNSKLEPLIKFQNDFDALLDEFCLDKQWIAMSILEAIWNGTGILRMEPISLEIIPNEVITEIKNRLGVPKEKFEIPYLFGSSIPPPLPFVHQEQYFIFFAFKQYEEAAIEAYRRHLHNYFKLLKESFQKYGYKQKRPPHKLPRLKWLVHWTVQNWSMKEIAAKYDTSKNPPVKSDENFNNKANKAFKLFEEKYDLPRRRKKTSEGK